MKYKFKIIIVICLLILFLSSCKKKENLKIEPIKVKTKILKQTNFEKSINLIGEIEAVESIDIYPKIIGKVISYSFEDGTLVSENTNINKDQVFIILDHEESDINYQQAQANYEMVKAALKITYLNLEDSKKNSKRMNNLFLEGAITENQKEMAFLELERTQAQYLQAKARLKEAQAFLRKSKMILDQNFIKSPINGILTKKYVEENNMTMPNSPIANIKNLNELKILVSIPEKIISQIEQNIKKAIVKVDAYPEDVFNAQIEKIFPTIDPTSRMGTLELRIKDNQILKPGMYANIELIFNKNNQSIKVPFYSLIYHQGHYQAYIYKEGKAYLKKLTVGDRNEKYVEIIKGLKEGDELIVLGQNKLTDQIDVAVLEEKQKEK